MNNTCTDCEYCDILTAELEYDIFICTRKTDIDGEDLRINLDDKVCKLFKEI